MTDHTQNGKNEKVMYCSFCGKSQNEVRKLIAGPSVLFVMNVLIYAMTL